MERWNQDGRCCETDYETAVKVYRGKPSKSRKKTILKSTTKKFGGENCPPHEQIPHLASECLSSVICFQFITFHIHMSSWSSCFNCNLALLQLRRWTDNPSTRPKSLISFTFPVTGVTFRQDRSQQHDKCACGPIFSLTSAEQHNGAFAEEFSTLVDATHRDSSILD